MRDNNKNEQRNLANKQRDIAKKNQMPEMLNLNNRNFSFCDLFLFSRY